jgi:hypothetical protein
MRAARAGVAVVVGALGLVTAGASAAVAAPATVTRGDFALLGSAPAGTTVAGRAQLVRGHDRTSLTVHLTGLAKGATYGVHLHNEACSAAMGHYKNDLAGPSAPPNELWASSDPKAPQAGVTANAAGNGQGRGDAPWRARVTARSVVVHIDTAHGGTTAGGTKLACADLS